MKNEVETQDSDFEPRIYEVGYLIVPSVAQEKLPEKITAIRGGIENTGAKILDEGDPKYQDLAYDMATTVANKKVVHKAGYFGWIKFEADPAVVETIENDFEKNTELIRFMVTKAVREDTLAPIEAAFAAEAEERARKEKEKEKKKELVVKNKEKDKPAAKPATKEEIDETIEKLIVE